MATQERKITNFKYQHHPTLKADIKINLSTGEVTVKQKYPSGRWVKYSKKELDIIGRDGGKIDEQTHFVKCIFEGEIV